MLVEIVSICSIAFQANIRFPRLAEISGRICVGFHYCLYVVSWPICNL